MTADTIQYPAWRFHTSGRTCVVESPEVDALLKKEPGWGDKAPPTPAPDVPPPAFGATDHAPVVEEVPVIDGDPTVAIDEPEPAPAPPPEPEPEPDVAPRKRKHR